MASFYQKFLQTINEVLVGFILTTVILFFLVSDAALAFSGGLSEYLAIGIGMMIISTSVVTLIISLNGSYKLTIATVQDTSVIILAVVGGIMTKHLQAEGSLDQLLPTFMMFIFLSSIFTGLSLVVLGYFKLGKFARFIPYQVVGGFLLGTGLMIIIISWLVMTGETFDVYRIGDYMRLKYIELWVPSLAAATTFFIASRIWRKVVIFPAIIFTMAATFYLVVYLSGLGLEDFQNRGVLLGPFPEEQSWNLPSHGLLENTNWAAIFEVLGNAIVLAILTALSLLLNVTGIEAHSHTDISLDKELKSAGFANFISPFLGGGVVSYHSIIATQKVEKSGGKTRLVTIAHIISLLVLFAYGLNFIGMLPKFIIAGMVLYLGIELSANWLYDFKNKFNYVEYGTMIFIGIMIVSLGFLEGVGIGTLISLVIFVVRYSRVQVVKQSLSGDFIHSNVERDINQREIFTERGDRIHLFKLNGFMFFGNTHEFLRAVTTLIKSSSDKLKFIIIDFKDLNGLDSSSLHSFTRIREHLNKMGIQLVFAHVAPNLQKMLLPHMTSKEGKEEILVFDDLDHSLEWCENELLKIEGYTDQSRVTLHSYLKSFVDSEKKVMEVIEQLDHLSVDQGYALFKQGEVSDDIYFLDSGFVEVTLTNDSHQSIRLRSIGPGNVVGEIGFYLKEPRSATVLSIEPCKMYRLSASKLSDLKKEKPEIAFIIEEAIIRQLASRLVYQNQQVHGLLRMC